MSALEKIAGSEQTEKLHQVNMIFLSPHFPFNNQLFCSRLHRAGVKVLAIDQIPYESMPSNLQESLHGYYKVSDLHNYAELAAACHHFINRYGPIHRIESHNEYWLPTQARLASEFHIPGLNMDTVTQVTRKSKMKVVFRNAGLTPARGELITTLERAMEFVGEVGYPVMLKPDIGVGSVGCQKIHSNKELRNFFDAKPSQEYLMEEFIEGEIFTFDGLVDSFGELLFHTSHVYNAGLAEVVRYKLDQYFYSHRTIPEDVEAIGRTTLQAFDVRERFFHFEYFRTHKDKRLIPIEVNMRPPGSPTLDMCNYACDIDLYQRWAEVIAGRGQTSIDCVYDRNYERKYHCMTISRRVTNTYLHSHEDVLNRGRNHIVHHTEVLPFQKATMGDYFYVVRNPDLKWLEEFQNYIQRLQ